jgi:hypothetical protein
MKFNRLGAFTLGVVITAVSVGAVSFVDAAGNGTLKACANKTTGVMRYIAKGSCKKTETTLSWNQMGSQGVAGSPGATGAKGEIGAAGPAGKDGRSIQLIDATGKDLGEVLGPEGGNGEYLVLLEGRLWKVRSDSYGVFGSGRFFGNVFSESSCSTALGSYRSMNIPSQDTFGYREGQEGAIYVASSLYSQVGDNTKNLYQLNSGTCALMAESDRQQQEWQATDYLFNLTPISPPTYVAPLTIVEK